jgi:nicotinate-nucleotide adenylyltransferase
LEPHLRERLLTAKSFGVFGGSFDPVHLGHIHAARLAQQNLALDYILLIPAKASPFKLDRQATAATHRLRMLELAIRGESGMLVSALECQREGPSYTFDTLSLLRASLPSQTLYLLLGADVLPDFPHWYKAAEISALAKVVVLTRPDYIQAPELLPPGWGADFIFLITAGFTAASSTIRTALHSNSDVDTLPLDAEVAGYIRQNELYSSTV